MAFALPLLVQIFEPIQMAVQWLSGGTSPEAARRPQAQRSLAFPDATAHALARSGQGAVGATSFHPGVRPSDERSAPQRAWRGPLRASGAHAGISAGAERPLRVIRVVDQRVSRAGAGRMVISGRMEDVCAELDRMAELETRH